ncbi:mandelate racemase/muconate lactonizing enzyme family protein, partial [Streptosporangium sp. NPDC006013]|uniref:mandelate racemase/muconate lactonizing enzyme family protein n=1 Tax=Streptosporangium sp. NPDC006013 TaxID=3155596 RepID=UPI0033A74D7F
MNAKITEVVAHPVRVSHREAYLGASPIASPGTSAPDGGYFLRPPWRSLYSGRFETLLVSVTCDDGTVGWGEALAPVAPEVPAAIVERLLAPVLVGEDPTRIRPLWDRLTGLMRERGHLVGHQADALAAVDIALWDLTGRLTGRSVAELIGGAFRETVPVYVSGLPRPTDGERAELAREWAARGATTVKLHLGHGVAEDLATVDAVATSGLKVAVDAHWVYDVPQAVRLARGLAERGALFLEAPLAPEDVEGHRELARRAELPIAVGESLRNRYEFAHWLGRRALGMLLEVALTLAAKHPTMA